MATIKKILRYWWSIVFKQAWKSAWKESEIKGWIRASIIAALAATVFVIFGTTGIVSSQTPIIGDVISNLFVQFALCTGSAIIFAAALFFALVYVPSDLYEKQEKIKREQDELIRPNVNLKLSEFSPDAHADGEKWVGLYIHNSSGICSIEKCKVTLLTFDPPVHGTSNLPADLVWSANNRPDDNGFIEIPRNGQKTLDIAWSFPGLGYSQGGMALARGFEVIRFPAGSYEIEFRIDGEINNNPIPPQFYSANVVMERGKDIRLEDICLARNKARNKKRTRKSA